MRIFVGLVEVARFVDSYCQGFRALGHETYSVLWTRSLFYPDSVYDVVMDEHVPKVKVAVGGSLGLIGRLRRRGVAILLFLRALFSCKVFVYVFGTSFLPWYLDYRILKLFRKRIVSVFLGSDIRYWYALEQEMRSLCVEREIQPFLAYLRCLRDGGLVRKSRIVKAAERHADLILTQPGCGQLLARPYMRANVPLNLSELRFNVPDREVPVVVHAPSNRGVKGTEYVLEAVDQLACEGLRFEFRLIERMPNVQLRALLAETDIVVDELFSDTVGVLSSEAMATGNVVLVRYMADYAGVPPGCPAVNVTKDTIKDALRRVVVDRPLRRRLAYAGRAYVEANNDHVRVTQQILEWLRPEGIQRYDFSPTFYRGFHVPSEILAEERREARQGRLKGIERLIRRLRAA